MDDRPDERDARVFDGRAMWLEDDDPRLSLSPLQFQGVRILAPYPYASQEAIDAAAQECRVSPGRVKRWLATRLFREALRRERDEPVSFGFGLLVDPKTPREVNEACMREALEFAGRRELTDTNEDQSDE